MRSRRWAAQEAGFAAALLNRPRVPPQRFARDWLKGYDRVTVQSRPEGV